MQDAPGCSYTAPARTNNTKALPPPDGNTADEENMIVEFASGDIFGDLTRLLHFEIVCYLMLLLWMMFDCGCCNTLVVVRT